MSLPLHKIENGFHRPPGRLPNTGRAETAARNPITHILQRSAWLPEQYFEAFRRIFEVPELRNTVGSSAGNVLPEGFRQNDIVGHV